MAEAEEAAEEGQQAEAPKEAQEGPHVEPEDRRLRLPFNPPPLVRRSLRLPIRLGNSPKRSAEATAACTVHADTGTRASV